MYLLIDDNIRSTDRLKQLLKELEVFSHEILEAHACQDALQKAACYQPDIIFLDIEMPGMNGFELWEKLQEQVTRCAVVITTAHEQYVLKALRARMVDYLQKPVELNELYAALERCQLTLGAHHKRWENLKKHGVTERQLEVVKLAQEGYTSKQIAEALFLSKHTVDTHRRNVLKITECNNLAELNRLL